MMDSQHCGLLLMLLLLALGSDLGRSEKRDANAPAALFASNRTDFGPSGMPSVSYRQARRSNALTDSCVTNDGASGTCMTRFKCMRQTGTVNGFCGTYGVCCETNLQCGQSSRLKRTIIRNPAVYNIDPCQYTIEAFSPNVRQLRIDFEQFELQQPTIDPLDPARIECIDFLEVGNFKLCGQNTRQHLYIPFNVAAGMDIVTLTFNIPTRWVQSNWRLVVTQVEGPASKRRSSTLGVFGASAGNLQDLRTMFASHHADFDLLAPPGCDQYYTAARDIIRSFNYNDQGSNYVPDIHYTICINSMQGASMIEYTFSRFNLAIQTGNAEGYDETCHPTVRTLGHVEDHLMIPQAYIMQNGMMSDYQPTYFCGLNNDLVVWASPPYYMHFSSDDLVYDANTETGFSISYRLISSIM